MHTYAFLSDGKCDKFSAQRLEDETSQHSTVPNQVSCPELTLALYKDKVLGILY